MAYMDERPEGMYVLHSDYAALAAENERLKAERPTLSQNPSWHMIGAYAEAKEEIARLTAEKEALVQQGIRDHQDWRSKLNFLEADYKAEIARLTAENERLRKAGDAIAEELIGCYKGEGYDPKDSDTLPIWNSAKEGRDAK